jgi:hypothetical protein
MVGKIPVPRPEVSVELIEGNCLVTKPDRNGMPSVTDDSIAPETVIHPIAGYGESVVRQGWYPSAR